MRAELQNNRFCYTIYVVILICKQLLVNNEYIGYKTAQCRIGNMKQCQLNVLIQARYLLRRLMVIKWYEFMKKKEKIRVVYAREMLQAIRAVINVN